jgi:hypothetical protein
MPNVKNTNETDSTFFLKIVMYFIIGSLWLYFDGSNSFLAAVPVGLLLGLFFVRHDHFAIDRKIEYVVLLISALLSYVLPVGVAIAV